MSTDFAALITEAMKREEVGAVLQDPFPSYLQADKPSPSTAGPSRSLQRRVVSRLASMVVVATALLAIGLVADMAEVSPTPGSTSSTSTDGQ
jgi:hypothetical protein